MLRPLRFLWEQFNGPQVTALFTAIFRYLQDQFNTTIDYFRHLDIYTANDAHLTLIGMLMGIPRPLIFAANPEFFLFTKEPGTDKERGFADLANRAVGGVFSDMSEAVSTAQLMPKEYFRRVLVSWLENKDVAPNSLIFIDTVIHDAWDSIHPGEPSPITIKYITPEDGNLGRTYGDIDVTMGRIYQWGTDTTAFLWQACFTSVFNNLLNPECYVDVNFL